ncbi:MAG TPA: hypothetical protein VGP76_27345 [Planctomycetaceae bacterium]|nr:hypothetical protein [Planctomycetaceae bacterium]
MPPLPLDARPTRLRTRLEASLIRLQAALRRGTQREATDESLYAEWHDRWAGRREELARRLTAIDSQLDSWAPKGLDSPRLAVITEASETEFETCDETGLGPYFELD